MLARRGLLRNTDPHMRCENVSDPTDARRCRVCETRIAMTVNLTRIYTKLGDGGETHLGDMSRVSKLHPRVEAYGTVDELNATIGVALLAPGLPERVRRVAAPRAERPARPRRRPVGPAPAGRRAQARRQARARAPARSAPDYTEWLEQACDEVNATLEPLRSFVIPGGTPGGGAPAHLPHRLPPRRAAHDRRRRGGQPGGRALPEPALGPAVHPQPRRQRASIRRRRSESEPLWDPGAHGAGAAWRPERRVASAALSGAARDSAARRPATASAIQSVRQQVAAEDVARHVPGEDQQRAADGRREERARAPRRAGAGGGRDEHRAQHERGRGGRVPARPRGGADVRLPPICACGWASSGLSISAVSGASPSRRATASATRGRPRASATATSAIAPDDEQRRVEQVQQDVAPGRSTRGPPSSVKSCSATASLHVRRGHERGDHPRQREREHAQRGDRQGAPSRPWPARGASADALAGMALAVYACPDIAHRLVDSG